MLISDRDVVIAASGLSKREYLEKNLSEGLESIIEGRSLYIYREGGEKYSPILDGGSHYVRCAMPIISEGDVVGCVVSVCDTADKGSAVPAQDIESKLIMTAAGFLGRQLEI